MLRLRVFLSLAVLLCMAVSVQSLRAQASPERRVWIGVHAGLQTNIQRYNVFPYTGEFQDLVKESMVSGLSACYQIDGTWALYAEVSWWKQQWSTFHDGEPRIEISREDRSFMDIPLLIGVRLPLDFIPLYVATGPVLLLSPSDADERQYHVTYAGFSERNGWQKSVRSYRDRAVRFAAAADIGLHMPLTAAVALRTSVRFMHPFGRAVDEEEFSLRDFSYWRMSMGIHIGL